jgi:excisionase family DNA binding protein
MDMVYVTARKQPDTMQTTHTRTELMRTREVADALGVTPLTVRELVRRGALPYIQYGPHSPFLFRRQDVERLLVPRVGGGRGT